MSAPNPYRNRAVKKAVHSTPETRRTFCDKCLLLDCIETGKKTQPHRFYCEGLHRTVDLSGAGCPGKVVA